MNLRLGAVAIPVFLAAIAVGQTKSDRFPDTPDNHWAYENLLDLKSLGILKGYPQGFVNHATVLTRRDLAVQVLSAGTGFHILIVRLCEANELVARRSSSAAVALDAVAVKHQALFWRTDVEKAAKDLIALDRFFSRELSLLGSEPGQVVNQVHRDRATVLSLRLAMPGEALGQFVDVPSDHWAATAIQNLRAEGIVHGYLDGKFRG
jgi:hypothetical protein